MVTLKNPKEIGILREGRVIMGAIFEGIKNFLHPGVTTAELDHKVEGWCRDFNVKPAFKGYMNYPACICASKNDAVVHGIPDEEPLRSGDIVGIDFGIVKDQLYLDSAYTFMIDDVSKEVQQLVSVTRQACLAGIAVARPGNTVQDISRAIQDQITPYKYGIVRGYVGHGIGYALHEEPQIPNYDTGHPGLTLKAGMTLAIEPMVNLGADHVFIDSDKWTVRTKDRKPSAHFEHTVWVSDSGPEILTQWPT